jgi:hypothetical protein
MQPHELKQIARRARAKANEVERNQRDVEREKQLQEEREQEERATRILNAMPAKCKAAAEKGRNFAVIMDLASGQDINLSDIREASDDDQLRDILGGAANLVYSVCRAKGFDVSTHYWHDGVGIKSKWQLMVHWPE